MSLPAGAGSSFRSSIAASAVKPSPTPSPDVILRSVSDIHSLSQKRCPLGETVEQSETR
jgi:hypothetical protein